MAFRLRHTRGVLRLCDSDLQAHACRLDLISASGAPLSLGQVDLDRALQTLVLDRMFLPPPWRATGRCSRYLR